MNQILVSDDGLSAPTRPPWASTNPSTVVRPRPAPPSSRDRDFSPRLKRSKMRGRSSSAIPAPVLAKTRLIPSGLCSAETLEVEDHEARMRLMGELQGLLAVIGGDRLEPLPL